MKNKLPNRKSIRLKGYDYSQAGVYFVTICTQNRAHLFGNIKNGEMILNDAGKMVETEWMKLTDRYKNIQLHEYVVMPNHFHAIFQIVGATLVVDPNVGQPQGIAPTPGITPTEGIAPTPGIAPTGKRLGDMVGAFKSITTVNYIRHIKTNDWPRFYGKLWQRNYWEHIIRNEFAYNRISQYIINNPLKWENDKLNNGGGNIVMEPSADYGNENWMNYL